MLDCSRRGSIILDPFIGSGTTIIAAETVGRRAYGMELDPQYVDVAVRRWERFTGRDAILEATGQTFAEVQAERSAPPRPHEPRAKQTGEDRVMRKGRKGGKDSKDLRTDRLDDYEVGYGRPPKEHQFKKGKSGNPRGTTPGREEPGDNPARDPIRMILIRDRG